MISSHLLKHYLIDRDTNEYALYPLGPGMGYMYPQIPGLNVTHRFDDDNGVSYCLSTCVTTLDYSKTVNDEGLTDIQNDVGVTTYTATQLPDPEPTDENPGPFEPYYQVSFTKSYTPTVGVGLSILTQEEWNAEISSYDTIQEDKRTDKLRDIRDLILEQTDWIVIRSVEQNLPLTQEFKSWRKNLRDLPQQIGFPTAFPTLASEVENNTEVLKLYDRWNEVSSIPMINDPLLP